MKKKVPGMKRHLVKKLDENLIEELCRYEDDFPDGVFAIPPSPDAPRVKVRALDEYCKRNGKRPSELSEEEMEMFLDRKPLNTNTSCNH